MSDETIIQNLRTNSCLHAINNALSGNTKQFLLGPFSVADLLACPLCIPTGRRITRYCILMWTQVIAEMSWNIWCRCLLFWHKISVLDFNQSNADILLDLGSENIIGKGHFGWSSRSDAPSNGCFLFLNSDLLLAQIRFRFELGKGWLHTLVVMIEIRIRG